MNRPCRCSLVAALLCFSLAASGAAGADQEPVTPADLANQIASVVEATYAPDQPGAVVLVVKDGSVIYRGARGMANLELAVPLQPDMIFRLGSITKQFTAAAIMLLVQDGKLALDDHIEKFLSDYPTQGHVITVEHLLTHTSGIQSYTDIPGWFPKRIVNDMSVTELVDGFKKEPMQFAPGERFAYNNSAYVLLGAIIENVSGASYEKFVNDRIFQPLGMTNTYYGNNEPIIPRRVAGYTREGSVTRNAGYLSMTQPYSAGSLISSVDDLAMWDAALYNEKILTSASLQRMWKPYTLESGRSTEYGFGWEIGKLRGRDVIEHRGGIPGFSTFALRIPESRVFVAVLCNNDNPKVRPSYIAKRLAAIAIGDPFRMPVAANVNPTVLAAHVGVYEIDKDSRQTVIVEDNKLFTKSADGERREAIPASDTEFFYENDLGRVRFERDAGGRTVAMLIYAEEGAEPKRAPRVPSA